MTREEAWEVIKLHKDWNIGQRSMHSSPAIRLTEENIFEERRKLIKKAYEVLNAS